MGIVATAVGSPFVDRLVVVVRTFPPVVVTLSELEVLVVNRRFSVFSQSLCRAHLSTNTRSASGAAMIPGVESSGGINTEVAATSRLVQALPPWRQARFLF